MRLNDRRYIPVTGEPADIVERGPSGTPEQRRFQTLVNAPGTAPIDGSIAELLSRISYSTNILTTPLTIGLAFTPRIVNVLPANGPNNATLIIEPNFAERGYAIQNPGELSGFSSEVTFFPLLLRTTAGQPYTSTAFNVGGIENATLFLNITASNPASPGGPALTIDVQSQDPLSGNWATVQVDVFAGANATGTYAASIGPLGVDKQIRLVANMVGGVSTTFSVSGLFKGTSPTPVGQTVYIGGPDVNTTFGFSILPGDTFFFFLQQNVSLYAITATETLALKIFQLK